MAVFTTVAVVLQQITAAISTLYPEFTINYSGNLDYVSAVEQSRSDIISSTPPTAPEELPLFVYNRSTIRPSDTLGMRQSQFAYGKGGPTALDVDRFSVSHSDFDLRFAIYDKDIATIESFEIDYSNRQGLPSITEVSVDLSTLGLGVVHYYLTWPPSLDDLTTTQEPNTYISTGGTVMVRGWFISLTGSAPVISDIVAKIYANNSSNLLDTLNIT